MEISGNFKEITPEGMKQVRQAIAGKIASTLGNLKEGVNESLVKTCFIGTDPNALENKIDRERYEAAYILLERLIAALHNEPRIKWQLQPHERPDS